MNFINEALWAEITYFKVNTVDKLKHKRKSSAREIPARNIAKCVASSPKSGPDHLLNRS